jgi:ABC-2 type transport system ATP-binding protein
MKMELIGAILHWPSVIFLDEPTIGLDVLAAQKLREFLRVFYHREKATIILTSHNMDDIERLCSRVLILRDGELIYDGKPDGLTKKGERQLRVRFVEQPSIEELGRLTGMGSTVISEDPDADESEGVKPVLFTVKQEQIVQVLQSLMGKFEIVDMGIQEQSLESVIQRLYESDRAGGTGIPGSGPATEAPRT